MPGRCPETDVTSDSGLPAAALVLADSTDGLPERHTRLEIDETVTDGNMPWWLMTIGAVLTTLLTSVLNGTSWPLDEFDINALQRFRAVLESLGSTSSTT